MNETGSTTEPAKPLSRKTLSRCTAYPMLMAFAYALGLTTIWSGVFPMASSGVVFPDYLAFHGGAVMAGAGEMTTAYLHGIDPVKYQGIIGEDKRIPWFYPPSFLVFTFWLPWVPLWVGAIVFLGITLAVFWLSVRHLFLVRSDIWLIIGAPASFVNFLHGQNAFLTAALLAMALRFLPHAQVRAGLALGLLTIKPHLGLLMPAILLGYRRWSSTFIALSTLAALIAATGMVYGTSSWMAFFKVGLSAARNDIESGALNAAMSSSPFGLLMELGVEPGTALAVQGMTCAFLLALILWLIIRNTSYQMVCAVSVSSTLIAAPHNFAYDWVVLLIPMLILWRLIRLTTPMSGEVMALSLLYFSPFAVLFLGFQGVSVGLPLNLLLLFICLRRSMSEPRAVI